MKQMEVNNVTPQIILAAECKQEADEMIAFLETLDLDNRISLLSFFQGAKCMLYLIESKQNQA